ncbi:MAG: hypothetical protein HUJ30_05170 [Gammaproteobacteria bacterium]|nr:hypothetical protein [Gammaproteobacteria bacterium]
MSYKTVINALDPEKHGTVSHYTVMVVRHRVGALLQGYGWQGDPDTLWQEYDQHIKEQAA